MSGDKEPLTKQQRADLCPEANCKEHGDGDSRCPIPLYKEDLQKALQKSEDGGNSAVSIGDAEPKTATGKVVRSNE